MVGAVSSPGGGGGTGVSPWSAVAGMHVFLKGSSRVRILHVGLWILGNIGVILGLYRGYIGIMEKKMETTSKG